MFQHKLLSKGKWTAMQQILGNFWASCHISGTSEYHRATLSDQSEIRVSPQQLLDTAYGIPEPVPDHLGINFLHLGKIEVCFTVRSVKLLKCIIDPSHHFPYL